MNYKKLGRNIEGLLFLGFSKDDAKIMLSSLIVNKDKINFENSIVYGMHDAPSGIQNMFVFKNLDGEDLKENDTKYIQLPWSSLNPNVIVDFNKEFQNRNGSYKKNIEIGKYKDFLTKKKNTIDIYSTHYVDNIISSNTKLRQSYIGISLEVGDYIYIRGKKGKLNKAWVFQVLEEELNFKKNNGKWITQKKMRAIKEISNETYEKIHAQRASIWNMNINEKKLLNI